VRQLEALEEFEFEVVGEFEQVPLRELKMVASDPQVPRVSE
jgi:hypothetical protein